MKTIFDILDYKFFQVFAGDNRRVNAEIIMVISDFYKKDNLSFVDKEDLVTYLTDYINKRAFNSVINEEDGNDISTSTPREKALSKINLFKRNGWLIEEPAENYRTIIQFDENALILLKAFEDINNNATPKEYTGYIYVIDNLLKHFDYSQGISILEQVYDNTETLMSRLRGLNSSIKRYLTNLLKDDDEDADKLLSTLLHEYQDNVINKAFSNLKLNDNPSKYKNKILNKLNELKSPEGIKRLVENYRQTKSSKESNEEIEDYLFTQIDYVYDIVDDLQLTISLIDQKNAKYIKSTTSKLTFILSDNYDVTGKIERILKLLKHHNDEEITAEAFGLYTVSVLDSSSLYKPRVYRDMPLKTEISPLRAIDYNQVEKIMQRIRKDNLFSKDIINNYVKSLLATKSEILASEIKIKSKEDYVRLILIRLYGNDRKMCYKTISRIETIFENNYEYTDFLISRRGGGNE